MEIREQRDSTCLTSRLGPGHGSRVKFKIESEDRLSANKSHPVLPMFAARKSSNDSNTSKSNNTGKVVSVKQELKLLAD